MILGTAEGVAVDIPPQFINLSITYLNATDSLLVQTNTGIDYEVPLSPDTFASYREMLSKRLRAVGDAAAGRDKEKLRRALWDRLGLAYGGSAALNELVGRDNGKSMFEWAQSFEELRSEDPLLVVDCPKFVLPWETLFFSDSGAFSKEGSMEGFLGIRFRIVRTLYPSSAIELDSKLNNTGIGVILDERLPGAKNEVEAIQIHAQAIGMPVTRFVDIQSANDHRRLENFKQFLQQDGIGVLHFACHAKVDVSNGTGTSIEVGNKFSVSITDLKAGVPLDLSSVRLVVLNACDTGFSRPDEILGFVSLFAGAGARSVVVTECPVESRLAAKVADAFWQNLCDASSISLALHGISTGNHPDELRAISLAYGYYGDPNLAI